MSVRFYDLGEYDELECDLCGSEMEVERDCFGPTSWPGAISGSPGRKYDFWFCPFREDPWHAQLRDLEKEKRLTKSARLRSIISAEMGFIKKTWEPTVGDYG